MRDFQRQRIRELGFEDQTAWYDRIEQVPQVEDEWTMVIAHEFFDALPVHVFQKIESGFREVLVDIVDRDSISPPIKPLRFVLSPGPTLASKTLLGPEHDKIPSGSRLELSPSSAQIAKHLANLLQLSHKAHLGGTGLVIDYGDDHQFGNSLRGFHRHQIVSPLATPGLTDITVNVDFSSLRRAMAPLVSTYGPMSQRNFLLSMGIEVRTEQLKSKLADAAKDRLVSKTGMGNQYKFLALESLLGGQSKEVYPFPPNTDS